MIQLTGFTNGFTDTSKIIDPAARFSDIVSAIISTMTIFAGIAFIFWFIIGALTWITGGHDPGQLDKAKRQMSTGIIGLIVTVATVSITFIIGKLTGINIINPENTFYNLIPQ